MRPEQWKKFRQAVESPYSQGSDPVIALIIDSPWLPGFMGISHLDYFFCPKTWLDVNINIYRRFPDICFIPGFWVEYGMAIEPSAFGVKIKWWDNNTPSIEPILGEDWSAHTTLAPPNPTTDGLMAVTLHMYKQYLPEIENAGHVVKFASARGPLALASHLQGLTGFLLDLELNPNQAKKLLEVTAETVIRWLKAQIEVLPDIEAILLLDDIPGMLSSRHFDTFAYPYLKAVFDAFPDYLKVYHNDANIEPFIERLPDLGIDVLNFTHNIDLVKAAEALGDSVCLLGNLPPVSLLVDGSPEEVEEETHLLLKKAAGRKLILSVGGGVSPGTPGENLDALVAAALNR
ncbi:MAG: uroporphyrinogen decarboxylase [Firmicutes bacterium]|nr:uroporphyrinogen decarboxylase [Bacillota bacterium]